MAHAKEDLLQDLELIDRRIVQPTADFIEIIGNIKKLCTKRAHKLIDYDRHRIALQKAKERKDRQANDERKIAEAEQKFESATRDYTSINNVLLDELPQFLAYRVHFIDPCFQTLFAVQLKVYRNMADTFYRLAQNTCDLSSSPYEGWERRKDEGERLLSELTILKGSWKTAASASGSTPIGSNDDIYTPSNDRGDDGGPPPYDAKLFPAAPPARKPAPPPPPKKRNLVVALYDFAAQQPGDLNFRKVWEHRGLEITP